MLLVAVLLVLLRKGKNGGADTKKHAIYGPGLGFVFRFI